MNAAEFKRDITTSKKAELERAESHMRYIYIYICISNDLHPKQCWAILHTQSNHDHAWSGEFLQNMTDEHKSQAIAINQLRTIVSSIHAASVTTTAGGLLE